MAARLRLEDTDCLRRAELSLPTSASELSPFRTCRLRNVQPTRAETESDSAPAQPVSTPPPSDVAWAPGRSVPHPNESQLFVHLQSGAPTQSSRLVDSRLASQ